MTSPLLSVRGLSVGFAGVAGRAVDELDLDLEAGGTLAVVGESGCGKSVTALSIMGLTPPPPRCTIAGSVRLDGRELVGLPPRELRRLRGRTMAMVFQEPMTSLNPVLTVGEQIVETLRQHERLSVRAARARAVELLELVRIPDAHARLGEYPHRFSGGMRQRVLIAIAVAAGPKLLIADEPTTALDVTIQAQILELLRELQSRLGTALLLITHDLGVVARMAQRVAVMYLGRKVEEAAAAEIFVAPRHPYTQGLIAASPHGRVPGGRRRLPEIPGQVPALDALPAGCSFAPRCPSALPRCSDQRPALTFLPAGHTAECFLAGSSSRRSSQP